MELCSPSHFTINSSLITTIYKKQVMKLLQIIIVGTYVCVLVVILVLLGNKQKIWLILYRVNWLRGLNSTLVTIYLCFKEVYLFSNDNETCYTNHVGWYWCSLSCVLCVWANLSTRKNPTCQIWLTEDYNNTNSKQYILMHFCRESYDSAAVLVLF